MKICFYLTGYSVASNLAFKIFDSGEKEFESREIVERKVKNLVNCLNGVFGPKLYFSYEIGENLAAIKARLDKKGEHDGKD